MHLLSGVWSKSLILFSLCVVLCSCTCNPVKPSGRTDVPVVSAVKCLGRAIIDPFVTPDHVMISQMNADMAFVNRRSKPVTAATGKRELTLDECRALALSNSLEIEQAGIEALSQEALEYSNLTRTLPRFFFSGELGQRDNEAFSYSEVLGQEGVTPNPGSSGTGVTNFSTGRERTTWRYVLETRWSPTDAALACYLKKNNRNDKIKHNYLRVRTAQRLIGLVDSTFLRLSGIQKALPLAQNLLALRKRTAQKAEELFTRQLWPVEDYHRMKQKLIRAERIVISLRNDAEQQRNLLASAMNMSPESCIDGGFQLIGDLQTPTYSAKVCDMELTAVRNRPEAYKAGLDHLNTVNDYKRAIIKTFPKLTGFWRYTNDKDKHLYENNWKDIGVLVYFDISEWYSNYLETKAAKLMAAKTEREMSVVALGISSQVRTAALKYFDAVDQLRALRNSLTSSEKVLKIQQTKVAKDVMQKLALEEAEGDLMMERIENFRALGEANALLAELQSQMGTNYFEKVALR